MSESVFSTVVAAPDAEPGSGESAPFLVDAHVHVHEGFDEAAFLDAAHANFRRQAELVGLSREFVGCALLAEPSESRWFERTWQAAREGECAAHERSRRWAFSPLEASLSMRASAEDGRSLLLVAGRQIKTRERLEVLALATAGFVPDGLSLADAVAGVRAQGGVPVIPWGAGKWLGRRGVLLRDFLEADRGSDLFLGDNGGRPGVWARPRHFRLAERLGIRVLPGSDPLPLPSDFTRAGASGFLALGPLSRERPARALKRLLRDSEFRPRAFGAPETSLRFLHNQLALRMRRARRDESCARS